MLCVVLWCVVYCVTVLLLLLSVSCLVMRLGCLILLCDFLVVRLSCGGVALSYLVVVLRLTSHILPFLLFCSLSFPFTRYILFSGVLPQVFSPMPGVFLQRCRHPLYQSPGTVLPFLPSLPFLHPLLIYAPSHDPLQSVLNVRCSSRRQQGGVGLRTLSFANPCPLHLR